ncbi:MAG: NAD-dependent epimerase/dehydratase family protein [Luteolibacter sp.]
MNILITGGAGFIGSHLVAHFQDSGGEIRVLDNLRTGSHDNLSGLRHTFIEGSVTDPDIVAKAMIGVDAVFHLAALVSVAESVEQPFETAQINVIGLLNTLEAAKAAGVKKFVLASSAAIYGDNPVVPKTEDMLPEPKSPYAITKLDGEYYLNLYHTPGTFETCSLRFFNVFGPRQNPDGGYAAAVPIFLRKALDNLPISIFGDGEQTRDFIYVKDIVSALVFASENPISGAFNAGYGTQMTINDLAQHIISLTGSSSEIQYLPVRAGDVRHSRSSVAKLFSAGWKPSFTLADALKSTVASMQA